MFSRFGCFFFFLSQFNIICLIGCCCNDHSMTRNLLNVHVWIKGLLENGNGKYWLDGGRPGYVTWRGAAGNWFKQKEASHSTLLPVFSFFRTGPLDVSTFGTEHEHPCGAFLPISPLLLTPFFSGCGAGLCECVSDKISTITTLIPLVLVSPLLLIHREAAKEWMVSEQNKKPPVTDPVTWHSPNVSGLVEWFKSSAGVKWLMWSLERESFRWLFPQHS